MRLLDLYCKAGGASKGYVDAGFEVTGIDIKKQKRYPFTFI
jgi:DNA (cytosine-5)-methyltransferase 1